MVQMLGWFSADCGTRLTPETFQCLWVLGHVIGQELERNEATQFRVLGLVNHAHTAAAELFDDAVACDGLADHWIRAMVAQWTPRPAKAVELPAAQEDCWRSFAGALTTHGGAAMECGSAVSGRITGKPEVSRVDGPGLKAHFF
jgi:hypothetical protein